MIKIPVLNPGHSPKIENDDQALINSTLQGNRKSFEKLIEKHKSMIFMMVFRQVRQREETEDVVQQVFVRRRNLRRMDSIDVPGKSEDSPARRRWFPRKSPQHS